MTKRFGFTLAGATHVDMQQKTVKNAFTLAEVLITLGIIGVVAAMTMPTLMNSTQGAQYKAAYKKALSALSQAVTLNVALDEWSFADATDGSMDGSYGIGNMLNSRMNVVRSACENGCTDSITNVKDSKGNTYEVTGDATGLTTTTTKTGINGNTTLFFNDGVMFTFPANTSACTDADGATQKICRGYIDVNGVKAPNRFVKCDNSTGTASATNCEIKNPTDVYPVIFYDQTVLPGSVAARAVLYSK